MKELLLIIVSVLGFSAVSVTTRIFQTKIQKSSYSVNLFQALYCLVAGICYFAVSLNDGVKCSPIAVLMAVAFGCCFAFASLFSAKCMEMGYMSVSAVIINLSLILPVMFSWVRFKEEVKLNSVIGLLLILIALIFSSLSTAKDSGNRLKIWLLFVSVAFFSNGGSAIIQKEYTTDYPTGNLMFFMALGYFTASVIFMGVYLFRCAGEKASAKQQMSGILLMILIAIIAGVGSFGGNGILGYLSNKVDGGILYPCINGGLSIVVALSSFAFFKEKLSKMKVLAIIIGLLAIIILNT